MTPDGLVPDLHDHHLPAGEWAFAGGFGLVGSVTRERDGTAASVEHLWQVRVTLRRAQDELIEAHAATVLTMGQLGRDHARLTDALVEARSQHEALFLVRRAVDALSTPARRAGE